MIEITYVKCPTTNDNPMRDSLSVIIEREHCDDPQTVAASIGRLVGKLVEKGIFTLEDAQDFVNGQIVGR